MTSDFHKIPIDPELFMASHDELTAYKHKHACDVCGNEPDEEGVIRHGRGCYTVDEDGGGESYVEPFQQDREEPDVPPVQ